MCKPVKVQLQIVHESAQLVAGYLAGQWRARRYGVWYLDRSNIVPPRTLRLVVSYDGTAYAGWQAQAEPPTVQAILTREARRLCGGDARVTGASRTDAGVHALRQTVSLTIASALPPAAILGALNAALPPDIRIREVDEATPTFHARYGAHGKRYAYLIDNGRIASPLLRRFAWHVAAPLDVGRMRLGLRALSGTHDFAAVQSAGSDGATGSPWAWRCSTPRRSGLCWPMPRRWETTVARTSSRRDSGRR